MLSSCSRKGSYLSACLHYLAIFGPNAHVIGNTEHAGLTDEDATLIQVIGKMAVYKINSNF